MYKFYKLRQALSGPKVGLVTKNLLVVEKFSLNHSDRAIKPRGLTMKGSMLTYVTYVKSRNEMDQSKASFARF